MESFLNLILTENSEEKSKCVCEKSGSAFSLNDQNKAKKITEKNNYLSSNGIKLSKNV